MQDVGKADQYRWYQARVFQLFGQLVKVYTLVIRITIRIDGQVAIAVPVVTDVKVTTTPAGNIIDLT